jgi:hypothetical protein
VTMSLRLEGSPDAMRLAHDARYELRVVGSCASLGAWDPHRAPRVPHRLGAPSTVEVWLPVGRRVEFKFVVVERVTGLVYWEPGRDRWLHRRCARG